MPKPQFRGQLPFPDLENVIFRKALIPPCKSWLAVDKCRFGQRIMITWRNDEYATNSSKSHHKSHHRSTMIYLILYEYPSNSSFSSSIRAPSLYENVIDDALLRCLTATKVYERWLMLRSVWSHSTFEAAQTQLLEGFSRLATRQGNLKKRMMPTKSTQAAPAFSPASSCSWAFCRFLPALVRAWITFQGLAPTRKDLLEPPKKNAYWHIAYGNSWLQYT